MNYRYIDHIVNLDLQPFLFDKFYILNIVLVIKGIFNTPLDSFLFDKYLSTKGISPKSKTDGNNKSPQAWQYIMNFFLKIDKFY